MLLKSPKITISICTYNRYDVLPKAIESALQQSLPPDDYEILVVDNSPEAKRAAAFEKKYDGIANLKYIIAPLPGLSRARNTSAELSNAPLLAFMDDDAVAHPTWLAEILQAFERYGENTMIVGGRVDPLWGAPRPPWLHESMLGNLSVVNWGGDTREALEHEWFAGTNITFRTQAIRDCGGFATNLGRNGSGASLLSKEELHLLQQIRAAGGKLIYAPNAVVEHLVEPERLNRSWFRKRSAWQAVSDYMMEPEKFSQQGKPYWQGLRGYFNSLPPHERTIRGLLFETNDPDLFRWQVGTIYMLTALNLAGFDGVDIDPV